MAGSIRSTITRAQFHISTCSPSALLHDENGQVCPTFAKLVDDIVISGEPTLVDSTIETFNIRLKLGTVIHSPNYFDKKSFATVNASIRWLGVTLSPFCARFSSFIERLFPKVCVRNLIYETNQLRQL